jgi:WD40 repeat protein
MLFLTNSYNLVDQPMKRNTFYSAQRMARIRMDPHMSHFEDIVIYAYHGTIVDSSHNFEEGYLLEAFAAHMRNQFHSNFLIVVCNDGIIRSFSLSTYEYVKCMNGYTNNSSVVALSGGIVASGNNSGTVVIWNVLRETIFKTFQAHELGIVRIIQLHDGRLVTAGADHKVKIWNHDHSEAISIVFHSGLVIRTVEQISNDVIATGTGGMTICLWNIKDGTLVQELSGHRGHVFGVAPVLNNKIVSCSGDRTVRIWDLSNGHMQIIDKYQTHSRGVWCIAKLNEGVVVTGSNDERLMAWDLVTSKTNVLRIDTKLSGKTEFMSLVKISENKVAALSKEDHLVIWDVRETKPICFSPSWVPDSHEEYSPLKVQALALLKI